MRTVCLYFNVSTLLCLSCQKVQWVKNVSKAMWRVLRVCDVWTVSELSSHVYQMRHIACMLVLVVFMFSISYVTNLALWLREFNKLTYLLTYLLRCCSSVSLVLWQCCCSNLVADCCISLATCVVDRTVLVHACYSMLKVPLLNSFDTCRCHQSSIFMSTLSSCPINIIIKYYSHNTATVLHLHVLYATQKCKMDMEFDCHCLHNNWL